MNTEAFYHYTTAAGMFGILDNKELWLMSTNFVNDPDELDYIKCSNTIQRLRNELVQEDEKYAPDKDETTIYSDYINAATRNSFICSLAPDGDSLTHWTRYADNTRGAALRINVGLMKHLLAAQGFSEITDIFDCFPLLYSDEKKKEAIREYIDKQNGRRPTLLGLIEVFLPLFKNGYYHDEQEQRLMLTYSGGLSTGLYDESERDVQNKEILKKQAIIESLGISRSSINYLRKDDYVRPYYKLNLQAILDLDKEKKYSMSDLIPDIVLGPNAVQNERDFKMYLATELKMYYTQVTISEAKYRLSDK